MSTIRAAASFAIAFQLRCPVCRALVSTEDNQHVIAVSLTADGTRADCYVTECPQKVDQSGGRRE